MSKPSVKLSGSDGNVFALLAKCTKALKSSNKRDEAKELTTKVFECASYADALKLMSDYCDIH
jgi:hypothetical protein